MYYPNQPVAGVARHSWPGLVIHRNGFDGALIDTYAAVGAESCINNGLFVALDSLGGTCIDTGFTGGAGFGVNFCWHLSTFLLLTKLHKKLTSWPDTARSGCKVF